MVPLQCDKFSSWGGGVRMGVVYAKVSEGGCGGCELSEGGCGGCEQSEGGCGGCE